jgi:signal peptidase I
MKAFLRDTLGTIFLAVAIFILLQATVQSFIVYGSSMEDTINDQQRLVISKVAYAFHEPERGDVVVFRPPIKREGDYIKRIIGLPGDTIEVKRGAVYVNDTNLDEPYVKESTDYTLSSVTVPVDNYFVLGDNRNSSNDSHNGWMVPRQNIIGKAWLSIWPPEEWEVVPAYPLEEQLVGF